MKESERRAPLGRRPAVKLEERQLLGRRRGAQRKLALVVAQQPAVHGARALGLRALARHDKDRLDDRGQPRYVDGRGDHDLVVLVPAALLLAQRRRELVRPEGAGRAAAGRANTGRAAGRRTALELAIRVAVVRVRTQQQPVRLVASRIRFLEHNPVDKDSQVRNTEVAE